MAKHIERYFEEVHQRRKMRRGIFLFFVGSVLGWGGLIVLLWAVFYSPFLRVSGVSVSGLDESGQRILAADMQAIVGGRSFLTHILGSDNILSWIGFTPPVSYGTLGIKRVDMTADFLSKKIFFTVEDRIPYGVWCQRAVMSNSVDSNEKSVQSNESLGIQSQQSITATSVSSSTDSTPTSTSSSVPVAVPVPAAASFGARECWWFDAEGIVVRKSPAVQGYLVPFVDEVATSRLAPGVPVFENEAVRSHVLSLLMGLAKLRVPVSVLEIEDASLQEARVRVYGGPTILFSLRFAPDSALAGIAALQAKGQFTTFSQLDFRVENRVYYK